MLSNILGSKIQDEMSEYAEHNNGTTVDLSNRQLRGLARICLAVGTENTAQNIITINKNLTRLMARSLHSIKLPTSATLKYGGISRVVSGVSVGEGLHRTKGFKSIFMDGRWVQDGNELAESLNLLQAEVQEHCRQVDEKNQRNILNAQKSPGELDSAEIPTGRDKARVPLRFFSIGINHMTDPEVLKKLVGLSPNGLEPVAVVSSSKIPHDHMPHKGDSPEEVIIDLATRSLDAGITNLFIAACDGKMLQDELRYHQRYPQMMLFGSGADTAIGHKGDHARPSLVEDVADYVDVLVLGNTVLDTNMGVVASRLLDFASILG